ncbi:DUF58 domain-containing protein [bacterium]|nr:DUF58 domain-containing protein [bacterium]
MFAWLRPTPPPPPPEQPPAGQRLRRLEVVATRMVQEVFAGQYESLFKGQGVEFSEIREYLPGDDVRSLDWNVTARLGRPFIKRNEEERELSMLVVIDSSASMDFSSQGRSKREVAAELAALLAFSALQNGDKVGLVRFCRDIEHVLPPRKGRRHLMRILGEVLAAPAQPEDSRLDRVLDGLNQVFKRRALVFVMSDLMCPDFSKALARAQKRHDLSLFRIVDPWEKELPDLGRLRVKDLETGESGRIDSGRADFRKAYVQRQQNNWIKLRQELDGRQVDWAEFSTHEPVVGPLTRFFQQKKRRRLRKGKS